MFPIKLTEHVYVNPEAIVEIEYIPAGRYCEYPLFNVIHENPDLHVVTLKGSEADEALANWQNAYKQWHVHSNDK